MNNRTLSESDLRALMLSKTNKGKAYFESVVRLLDDVSDTEMASSWNPFLQKEGEVKVKLLNNQWVFQTMTNGTINDAYDMFSYCGRLNGLDPIKDFVKICAIIDTELNLGLVPAVEIKIKTDQKDQPDSVPRMQHEGALLPVIPKSIYQSLPPFLQELTGLFNSQQDKDLLLLSTLTVLSGCFPQVYGKYNRKEIHLNIYSMIVAAASAGKSVAKWSRVLLETVEDEYEKKEKMLFFPVDISFAALIDGLYNNDGRGIMFAFEADSLTQNFSKEWGNTTALLRQAFEHERYENMRKGEKGKQSVSILKKPALSILLTGTPNQVAALIKDTEDGLFSRFSFYRIEMDPTWRNVFPDGEEDDPEASFDELIIPFKKQAFDIFRAYNNLDKRRIRFKLSKDQQKQLDVHFYAMSEKYKKHTKTNAIATIRRQGVVCFRLAGILTAIRSYKAPDNDLLICSEEDFQTALAISDVFSHHAFSIASQLPESNKNKFYHRKQIFLDNLPEQFTKQEAVKVAELLELKEHSVEKYLEFLVPQFIERLKRDHYRKVGNESQRSV